jgi:hypothetical protein
MDIIFKDVLAALTALTDIRWVDEDQGQLDIYQDPPVVFPCALVSVEVPEWQASKEPKAQLGRALITVKLGFNVLHKIGNAPEAQLTKALEHFATIKKVTKALRGKTGSTYRGLERTSTRKMVNEIGIKIYTVTFTCTLAEALPDPEPVDEG